MRGPSPSQRHGDLGPTDSIQWTHIVPETVGNMQTVSVCVFAYMCAQTHMWLFFSWGSIISSLENIHVFKIKNYSKISHCWSPLKKRSSYQLFLQYDPTCVQYLKRASSISQELCSEYRKYVRNGQLPCTRENDPIQGPDGKMHGNTCSMCEVFLWVELSSWKSGEIELREIVK